ncbi:MAG: sensor histidine kinase [Oscillospiraceae bacterium]|nr:sensor histidine kinase [Oscillospiraceae bacterium]
MLLQILRVRLEDTARKEAEEQLDSVSAALEQLCQQCTQTALSVQRDPILSQALTWPEELEQTEIYSRFLDVTKPVRSVARFDLYNSRGVCLYSTRSIPRSEPLSTNWGLLPAADRAEGLMFSAPEDPASSSTPLLQGAIPLQSREHEPLGYLVVGLYQSDLNRLFRSTLRPRNDLLLLTAYWRPVYCTQPGQAVPLSDTLRARLLEGQSLDSGTEEFAYTAVSHPSSGLYAVLRQPQALTQDTLNLLYTVCLSLFLLCILVSVLMSLLLSRQMFLPIERIHQAIGEVVHNNLDVYVPHERDDELGQLAERFNGMLVALKKNQEQLVENQRELNEAQIRMLQAQLNPHFLCNTLDTMKWISKINSVPQVAVMSTNLADILRFCVSPEEFVPLSRELEILQRYVEIQRIRLSGAFTFSVEVPPELLDCPVPKMILQPIVENAILHGLEGVEHGSISVHAEPCQGVLSISVTDNGRGLPPELVGPYASRARELSRGHLGLYNVDTILRKHYGDRFGLYLCSRPDGSGAVVTAALPIQNEEEAIC